LPSLYKACHEEAYKPGRRGFAEWPRTKWPWFGELAERGYLVVAVHRGKNLLVSGKIAALLDPICRAEIERMRADDPAWDRLLEHLAAAGPSNIGDLQVELDLKPMELKSVRSPLERCGAIVSRSLQLTAGGSHVHSSELARWDQVFSGPGDVGVHLHHAFQNLLLESVRAVVVAPEAELKRWFSWRRYWTDALIEDLVREGRLRRIDGHVSTGESDA
jgi:hypothetical protein